MTSKELTDKINAARLAEFGPDITSERFPAAYFRSDVVTYAPDGTPTPRAPRYCATYSGAGELQSVVRDDLGIFVAMTELPAMELLGGWSDSENVPWLIFEYVDDPANPGQKMIGVKVNAGNLLDYYNHGYPPNRARNSCELEIYDAYVAAGLKPELSASERQAIMAKP